MRREEIPNSVARRRRNSWVISPDELLEAARVYDLSQADVQRDYVFGLLIAGVFNVSELGSKVVLKGGYAFRKGYFAGTRFSYGPSC